MEIKDLGETIISKLQELNLKLDELLGRSDDDGKEES
jgi:hypothetical protein